jgi:acetate---CoA ligase (ADP-forming)
MINKQLVDPKSIVVIGGSNDITKPGGKVLKNLIDGNYTGNLYVVNLKEKEVQGIRSYQDPKILPNIEMAIIAIAARFTFDWVKFLTEEKNTKAFIILSAGFSELNEEGRKIEHQIVEQVNKHEAALIGPNCIGMLTPAFHGVFTQPIPKLDISGCDLLSGSGATACYFMESGIHKGLSFSKIISTGNSAQMGIEEMIKYMDITSPPESTARVKLLYFENINQPQLLLKHASSLIRKGCKIAAIKAGSSEAGIRAASSHTGALATPDVAVDALFRKAGIIRCYIREELVAVASVFLHPGLKGKNIAIITHAGGPAVMLTDALSNGGMNVPPITGIYADELKSQLFPGSSVANPIDFLATGTAEQLGIIIDYVNEKFDHIDAMVVIFGTPGLVPINEVYNLLDEKMKTSKKPIFPVLPSIVTAKNEVAEFLSKGRINFPDEVLLGTALAKVFFTPEPQPEVIEISDVDVKKIRNIVDAAKEGYLSPQEIQGLLDAAYIPRTGEEVVTNIQEALEVVKRLNYPLVMKVVGPLHKSDVGGVALNVNNESKLKEEFPRMMKIPQTTGILLQPMLSGIELFIGVKREGKFGHLVVCGLGGIFIEVLKDVQSALAPVSKEEALDMIARLKGKKILEGVRGQKGINIETYAQIITRVSALVVAAPEITEMDLNPLLGSGDKIVAVDARIKIRKNN